MSRLTALGITDGIGSLLWGAKEHGFQILGNHEWRKYYGTGTFEKNFSAPYMDHYNQMDFGPIDFIASHPECGNFSNLYTGKNRETRNGDPGDIWDFIKLAQKYKPKFFLADNLYKSLLAVNTDDWREAFPDYNITFEWVSNYHYGNTQFNRRRMFAIGSLKELDYKFVPGEFNHEIQLIDVIDDIPDDAPNHQKMGLEDITQWSGYQIGKPEVDRRLSLHEIQEWMGAARPGNNLPYYNRKGELKSKPGYSVIKTEHRSPVLSGGGGFLDNHWINDGHIRPLTMRERMRIQGFPDDYILTPDKYEYGSHEHRDLIKQTGKCMPNEFPTYFAKQIKEFLLDGTLPTYGKRLSKIPEPIAIDMINNSDLYFNE